MSFFILEYIWVFVILASAGTAIVGFSVVKKSIYGQCTWVEKYTATKMQRKEQHISTGATVNMVWFKQHNIY